MMDKKITRARDMWITKFKESWDAQLDIIRDEKQECITALELENVQLLSHICSDREKQLFDVNAEFELKKQELLTMIAARRERIEEECDNKMTKFLTSKLKTPTMYESIYAYCSAPWSAAVEHVVDDDEHVVDDE